MQSMTGFGNAEGEQGGVTLTVEIRSLNHRHFDFNLKSSAHYSTYEQELRQMAFKQIARGKVDCSIRREVGKITPESQPFNNELFHSYYDLYSGLLTKYRAATSENIGAAVISILGKRELYEIDQSESLEQEKKLLFTLFQQALDKLASFRATEGAHLQSDIENRLNNLVKITELLCSKSPSQAERIKERLTRKIKEIGSGVELDPARLAEEVIIYSERFDISEELTRMTAHCKATLEAIKQSQSGKKIEFLMQELGRELNTTAAKCQDAEMQHLVVAAKLEIEKIREQASNVE